MAEDFTDRGLEKYPGTGDISESQVFNAELLDKGLLTPVPVAQGFGQDVLEFDPICILEADDQFYKADGNDATKQILRGLAFAAYSEDDDGILYGPNCIATKDAWDWDMDKLIFVDNAQALSQTPGTLVIIAGYPLAPKIMMVLPDMLTVLLTFIADTAAASAITATSPGSGADGTTPNGAEWAAAVTDIGNIITNLGLINTTQAAILDLLVQLKLMAPA